MAEQFNADWARGVLENGKQKAESIIGDPGQIDALLGQLQDKLKDLPGEAAKQFANVPLMASMVKSYVSKEYTEVSPKVVIALVSAFLYLVKSKDLIPDYIPVIGLADDLAVVAIALAVCQPELEAYSQWRDSGAPQAF
jgi:uncharacterized membrane protein YkvA (DUF1232 family)